MIKKIALVVLFCMALCVGKSTYACWTVYAYECLAQGKTINTATLDFIKKKAKAESQLSDNN